MVTQTYIGLNPEKQARVFKALLEEFSTKMLADAQISNIVTRAEIARGAFYKYFETIDDAYAYVIKEALTVLHQGIPSALPQTREEVVGYIERVKAFLEQAQYSEYFGLFQMHFRANEERHRPTQPDPELDPFTWHIATLIHQTLRECFLDYKRHHAYIDRLQSILMRIVEK